MPSLSRVLAVSPMHCDGVEWIPTRCDDQQPKTGREAPPGCSDREFEPCFQEATESINQPRGPLTSYLSCGGTIPLLFYLSRNREDASLIESWTMASSAELDSDIALGKEL